MSKQDTLYYVIVSSVKEKINEEIDITSKKYGITNVLNLDSYNKTYPKWDTIKTNRIYCKFFDDSLNAINYIKNNKIDAWILPVWKENNLVYTNTNQLINHYKTNTQSKTKESSKKTDNSNSLFNNIFEWVWKSILIVLVIVGAISYFIGDRLINETVTVVSMVSQNKLVIKRSNGLFAIIGSHMTRDLEVYENTIRLSKELCNSLNWITHYPPYKDEPIIIEDKIRIRTIKEEANIDLYETISVVSRRNDNIWIIQRDNKKYAFINSDIISENSFSTKDISTNNTLKLLRAKCDNLDWQSELTKIAVIDNHTIKRLDTDFLAEFYLTDKVSLLFSNLGSVIFLSMDEINNFKWISEEDFFYEKMYVISKRVDDIECIIRNEQFAFINTFDENLIRINTNTIKYLKSKLDTLIWYSNTVTIVVIDSHTIKRIDTDSYAILGHSTKYSRLFTSPNLILVLSPDEINDFKWLSEQEYNELNTIDKDALKLDVNNESQEPATPSENTNTKLENSILSIEYNPFILDNFCRKFIDNYPHISIPQKADSKIKLPRDGKLGLRGYKEADFEKHLRAYFTHDTIKIHNNHFIMTGDYSSPYEPDFTLIKTNINLYIDIEIDEPYAAISREATHYNGIDDNRNQFFNDRGWVVIRFSEKQVHLYPEQCCAFIATAIHQLDSTYQIPSNLQLVLIDEIWTKEQAEKWAKENYRENYLEIDSFGLKILPDIGSSTLTQNDGETAIEDNINTKIKPVSINVGYINISEDSLINYPKRLNHLQKNTSSKPYILSKMSTDTNIKYEQPKIVAQNNAKMDEIKLQVSKSNNQILHNINKVTISFLFCLIFSIEILIIIFIWSKCEIFNFIAISLFITLITGGYALLVLFMIPSLLSKFLGKHIEYLLNRVVKFINQK